MLYIYINIEIYSDIMSFAINIENESKFIISINRLVLCKMIKSELVVYRVGKVLQDNITATVYSI